MKKIITHFVKYPVWNTVLMLSVVLFGLISMSNIRMSFFPEIQPDTINIQVTYPGASPDEVAEGVVLKIEENLDGLEGIERITSVSRENFGQVTVEITRNAELDKVLNDVKNAVDRINSFPAGIEEPVIFEQKFRSRALSIVLYGTTDRYNLKYISEQLRDELLATDEISQVTIEGLPLLEFSIEVSESEMRRYGITFDEIAAAVRTMNVNISGGKIETPTEEILIRSWGRAYHPEGLYYIPVRENPDGSIIYLGDIAEINEQWENVPDKSYYNGNPAVILNIDQAEQEDILAIADKAKEIVAEFESEHTAIKAEILDDRTIPLEQRIQLLIKNGIIGLVLIVLTLGFFLKLRLSWWVAVSIPFSFAGMFIVAWLWGITINVISLFGMILVVGILVDDAIVVGENIYAEYEKGKKAMRAAIDGTMQVIAPVSTAVTTTVLVFLAFFFLDGMLGKFYWQMSLVVIASLVFSLVEAFLILPGHLAFSKALQPQKSVPKIRRKIEGAIKYLTHGLYAPALRKAMEHKWITIMVPVAFVMLTIGLVGGGLIGVTFFPYIDQDRVPVNLSLVPGTQEAKVDSILARIETVCWEVNEEMSAGREDGEDIITGIKRDIGTNDFGESGSHAGRLLVQLLEGEQRDLESIVIANRIREEVGPVPEAQNITYGVVSFFGKPVSVSLLGTDFEQLDKARGMLVDRLEDFETLTDVTDSYQRGRREIDIKLKPRAYALGLSLQDIVGQVRQGFFGYEVQRIQRGRDEIRVWVRYSPEDRSSLDFLDEMRVRTPSGEEYPFGELADYSIKRGITTINHLNRMTEIKVEANMADVQDDLPPILAEIREDVLPGILSQVEGVKASFEGQSRDQAKLQSSMAVAFPLALLGMFILVILVFRSFAQAVIIFSLIPIGMLGAIWGHGIQGMQVSMLSLAGIIALSGIIVNDSIILVDQVNRYLREGQKVFDAVFNASMSRMRPILLTTLTTSLGLAPLIMETSRQAQFLIPMAISVAYGLIFGTFVLLLILPATVLVLNTFRVRFHQVFMGGEVTRESVEPAVRESFRNGLQEEEEVKP
ncbi:MAG: AcrB/AcrD/AcrF family protein [candidate division Zixibacteria bacterium]|nr:AcrB/AcrD/AcrF family protein [candidate division Zixibacteria bacterium]